MFLKLNLRIGKYDDYFAIESGELKCLIRDCNYKTKCTSTSTTQKARHLQDSDRDDHKNALAEVEKTPKPKKRTLEGANKSESSSYVKISKPSQNIATSYFGKKNYFKNSIFINLEQPNLSAELSAKIDRCIAEMMAVDGMPLQTTEKPGFQRLMQLLVPQYNMKYLFCVFTKYIVLCLEVESTLQKKFCQVFMN